MSAAPPNRRDTGFLLLAFGWLVVTIGVRPLALPDEGRYVSAAWQMVVSGQWLYPTLNGLPFFHKPPLYYWITGAGLAVFGPHEWAGRVAALTGAVVAVLALYGFARRRSSQADARLAVLVLTTMPLFFGSAQFASLDMLVGGFIFAATALAGEAALQAERGLPYRGFLTSAYACAALGVLAKGLIGAVLPGLAILLWLLWSRRPRLLLTLLWWPGLLLFAAIAVPWFVAMQLRFPDFVHYFFVYQQFQRYAQGGFNNPQPFWFYVPVLALGLLPWSLRLWRKPTEPAWQTRDELSPRALMWIAVAVTVGFFSVPASKVVGYALPAVPPLAYLIAAGAGGELDTLRRDAGRLRWFVLSGVVICLVAVAIGAGQRSQSNRALSRRIATQRAPQEPVYFFHYEFYDVPFYLRLREPVKIVNDWRKFEADAAAHDDWRNEVADAGKFDPEQARRLLLEDDQLPAELCQQPVAWVIAKKTAVKASPLLQRLAPAFSEGDRNVYRISAPAMAALGVCPQTPSDGSPGTSAQPQPPG